MISFVSGAAIAAATFSSAFVSGIFGMVGGQILLAVLLYYLPVATAMTVFSGMMFVNGAWRGLLWRQHIHWPITVRYIIGSVAAVCVMLFISYVPSKPIVYLGIGLLPFIGDLVPRKFAPDISRPGMAWFGGFLIMALQLAVGAAGNVLDMFFQASPLNRHVIVATKAVTQLFAQVVRFLYFGAVAEDIYNVGPWWFFAGLVILSVAGTMSGGAVLNRISDTNFRKGTRYLIWLLSAIYVARGLWLLATGSTT